ncbi:MAG: GNAT family N-acetyltransferase [Verrucomicrobiales bacterium]|nr:GNAT family N-acetyltransferase [Verrucomicrobiales bacterium]
MKLSAINFSERRDIEKLVRLVDAHRHTLVGGRDAPLEQEIKDKLLSELPRYSNAIAFVAERPAELAGVVFGSYALYIFSGKPCANVQLLFVRPEFQRRGLGRKLMLAFEEKARELGCCKITLEVREVNDPAKGLYRGLQYSRGRFGPRNEVVEFWEKNFQ